MRHIRLVHPLHPVSTNKSNLEETPTKPIGRINLSNLTGFLVNPSPTKVTLFTIRFQLFDLCLPVLITLNISSSAIPRTLGNGTAYFAARSFRLSLMADDSALASWIDISVSTLDLVLGDQCTFCPSRSNRYVGKAPSCTVPSSFCLTFRSSCAFNVFFI